MPSPQDSSSTTASSTGPPSVVSPPAGKTASSDSGSALTESTCGSGGRGAGCGGRGYRRYRGRGRGNRGQGYQTAKHKRNRAPTPKTEFKGKTDNMNGHIFQTTAEWKKNQQFKRTLEALQAYAFKNLNNANDIMPILLKDEDIPEPKDISEEDAKSKLKQRVWEKSVDKYVDSSPKM